MFRKTLTAAVAALTLAGATVTTTSQAQAGSLGRAVVAGVVGTVIGLAAGAAASARSQDEGSEYRPVRSGYGYGGGYRPVRGGHESTYGGCGIRVRPVFDEDGNRVGVRRVPTC